jgi:hypothetical protein
MVQGRGIRRATFNYFDPRQPGIESLIQFDAISWIKVLLESKRKFDFHSAQTPCSAAQDNATVVGGEQ